MSREFASDSHSIVWMSMRCSLMSFINHCAIPVMASMTHISGVRPESEPSVRTPERRQCGLECRLSADSRSSVRISNSCLKSVGNDRDDCDASPLMALMLSDISPFDTNFVANTQPTLSQLRPLFSRAVTLQRFAATDEEILCQRSNDGIISSFTSYLHPLVSSRAQH